MLTCFLTDTGHLRYILDLLQTETNQVYSTGLHSANGTKVYLLCSFDAACAKTYMRVCHYEREVD
jgi:hypothetical protein